MATILSASIVNGRHRFVVCKAAVCEPTAAGHGVPGVGIAPLKLHPTYFYDLVPEPQPRVVMRQRVNATTGAPVFEEMAVPVFDPLTGDETGETRTERVPVMDEVTTLDERAPALFYSVEEMVEALKRSFAPASGPDPIPGLSGLEV